MLMTPLPHPERLALTGAVSACRTIVLYSVLDVLAIGGAGWIWGYILGALSVAIEKVL